MFDLEQSIVKWRKQMLAAGIKTPVPLEELEIHLREDIEQRMKAGLDARAAFDVAIREIGLTEVIKTEFKKVDETVVKTAFIPALVFALLIIGNVVFLGCTVTLLPQRMATHFDANGQPNGWMNRFAAVLFQGAVGLILPLIIAAAFCAIKFVAPERLKVPHRDFWFATGRRTETCTYLSRQGLWLASLMVALQSMVWYELIVSNSTKIPQLSSLEFLTILGVFGLAMIAWVLRLFHHFAKPGISDN